jgi:hypothetical protein
MNLVSLTEVLAEDDCYKGLRTTTLDAIIAEGFQIRERFHELEHYAIRHCACLERIKQGNKLRIEQDCTQYEADATIFIQQLWKTIKYLLENVKKGIMFIIQKIQSFFRDISKVDFDDKDAQVAIKKGIATGIVPMLAYRDSPQTFVQNSLSYIINISEVLQSVIMGTKDAETFQFTPEPLERIESTILSKDRQKIPLAFTKNHISFEVIQYFYREYYRDSYVANKAWDKVIAAFNTTSPTMDTVRLKINIGAIQDVILNKLMLMNLIAQDIMDSSNEAAKIGGYSVWKS